jgi:hypothetical protein
MVEVGAWRLWSKKVRRSCVDVRVPESRSRSRLNLAPRHPPTTPLSRTPYTQLDSSGTTRHVHVTPRVPCGRGVGQGAPRLVWRQPPQRDAHRSAPNVELRRGKGSESVPSGRPTQPCRGGDVAGDWSRPRWRDSRVCACERASSDVPSARERSAHADRRLSARERSATPPRARASARASTGFRPGRRTWTGAPCPGSRASPRR